MTCDHQFFREPYASGAVMEVCVNCGDLRVAERPAKITPASFYERTALRAKELLLDLGVVNER